MDTFCHSTSIINKRNYKTIVTTAAVKCHFKHSRVTVIISITPKFLHAKARVNLP